MGFDFPRSSQQKQPISPSHRAAEPCLITSTAKMFLSRDNAPNTLEGHPENPRTSSTSNVRTSNSGCVSFCINTWGSSPRWVVPDSLRKGSYMVIPSPMQTWLLLDTDREKKKHQKTCSCKCVDLTDRTGRKCMSSKHKNRVFYLPKKDRVNLWWSIQIRYFLWKFQVFPF